MEYFALLYKITLLARPTASSTGLVMAAFSSTMSRYWPAITSTRILENSSLQAADTSELGAFSKAVPKISLLQPSIKSPTKTEPATPKRSLDPAQPDVA